MRTKIVSLLGVIGALVLVPVAQAAPATGFYIGGAWGAYSVDRSDLDDSDDMLRGFAGFQINELFAIEGQWTDFNRMSNDNSDRFEADGKGISAVLSFPFSDRSAVIAKVGNFWWESDSSFAGASRDEDGSDPFFGAGVKFGFNKNFALRVEWERYDIAGIDLDAYSVGLQFTF